MDAQIFLKLIATGENETIEFKKSTSQWENSLKTICGFLNHKGGTVYFGISDKNEIVGQQVSDLTLKSISQKIRHKIKPEISPEIKVLEISNKKIIEAKIKEGTNKPYYLNNIAYKRVGSESVPIPPEELEIIILNKNKNKIPWDMQICETATLDDIDIEKVKWFLNKTKIERNLDISIDAPLIESLEKLGLIKKGNCTNAVILLFGKNPQLFFLQANVNCAKFKGIKVSKPFLDMNRVKGNLFEQINSVERFILNNIKKLILVESGKIERQEKWEYPPRAICELLINALCHRDYKSFLNVHVSIFDDRIEIWNPGKLHEPLKPEDLKKPHKSIPVNPLLAELLFLVKYIERWGSGTVDVIKWCIEDNLPEPLFKEEFNGFSTILRKYKITDELLITLNERQRKAINYMIEYGQITNKIYQVQCPEVSRETLRKDLNELINKKIILMEGTKRGIYYTLA